MKHPAIATAIVVACLPFALHAVAPGDSHEVAVAELGAPTGTAVVGSNTIMFYARGEVKLREGRVVAANLVSAEELAARQAAEAAAIKRMDEAAQARLARLEAEGRAVYAAKKSEAIFATLPAQSQLTYWRSFATRYPMVPVAAEIAPLTERVEHELRVRELAAASEARLAELEARVADAEDRAARAEREARDDYDGYGYGYGLGYGYGFGYGYGPDYGYGNRPGRPGRGYGDHTPRYARSYATPPRDPMDAARGEAMGEIEAARRRAYAGGAQPPSPSSRARSGVVSTPRKR